MVNRDGLAIQKELTMNLVATTQTITEVEKANYEFDQSVAENNDYRYQLSGQINEIDHLMRMLNCEIYQQDATRSKVEYVAEKEKEMQRRKDVDEQKLVQAIVSDVQTQLRSLNQQVEVLNTAEEE